MNLPATADGRVTRLAVARAARAVSCAELGDAVGVPGSVVAGWERGSVRPSPAQVCAVALRLGWSVEDLVGDDLLEGEAWSLAVACRNRMVLGLRPR